MSAQEPERYERHRVPADFMSFRGAQWLERDERVEEEQPDAVLEAMGLELGDVAADIGCGSGYYARRMAGRVGSDGRVYCVDIQPEMLDLLKVRAREQGIRNVDLIVGEIHDPRLEKESCDLILMADVYHELSHPAEVLQLLRKALKPEGRVAALEVGRHAPDEKYKEIKREEERRNRHASPPPCPSCAQGFILRSGSSSL